MLLYSIIPPVWFHLGFTTQMIAASSNSTLSWHSSSVSKCRSCEGTNRLAMKATSQTARTSLHKNTNTHTYTLPFDIHVPYIHSLHHRSGETFLRNLLSQPSSMTKMDVVSMTGLANDECVHPLAFCPLVKIVPLGTKSRRMERCITSSQGEMFTLIP